MCESLIEKQYTELKEKLEAAAEQYEYNFRHPHVLAVSRNLDQVIVRMMEDKCRVHV